MINAQTFVCNDGGVRIDVFCAASLGVSRTAAARLIDEGGVTCNGAPVVKNRVLKAGDRVEAALPDAVESEIAAQDIPLDVVYEDGDLLVVNKPKGMVVHPAPGNADGTLVNALLAHCAGSLSGIGGVIRPGIVHRIDKDTSGLLIVAKNDAAHNFLARQIKEHSFTREYEAVLHGHLKTPTGTVNAPIGRHPVKRKQMAVTAVNSKPAVTHWEVLEELEGFSYVKLRLETGRTHQIRTHMAYIGHPVAGDTVYGPKKPATAGGQVLHARSIGFIHPASREYMEFSCDLPPYFKEFLKRLGSRFAE